MLYTLSQLDKFHCFTSRLLTILVERRNFSLAQVVLQILCLVVDRVVGGHSSGEFDIAIFDIGMPTEPYTKNQDGVEALQRLVPVWKLINQLHMVKMETEGNIKN